ncbi:MAG: cob(I)yrinic acid a,c-diamide adenosyltransferase [Patescibacteria group bacterium]|nr:cob(I)yrinic acid a,c-diamide adenosyltransferase [Patescibacteria group bacterium]
MLYTRKGDDGMSGLFGTKERLPKNNPIYNVLGTLDELNSLLGLCRAQSTHHQCFDIHTALYHIQQCLFVVQAEFAGAPKELEQKDVNEIENTIDTIEIILQGPCDFVVPGSTELSALLDCARAVSRRAERAAIEACSWRNISPATRAYLNRLSSLLYALARYAAAHENVQESAPTYITANSKK